MDPRRTSPHPGWRDPEGVGLVLSQASEAHGAVPADAADTTVRFAPFDHEDRRLPDVVLEPAFDLDGQREPRVQREDDRVVAGPSDLAGRLFLQTATLREVPIQALPDAIRGLHGCDSEFVQAVAVVDRFDLPAVSLFDGERRSAPKSSGRGPSSSSTFAGIRPPSGPTRGRTRAERTPSGAS
jgi:hypothetical protein